MNCLNGLNERRKFQRLKENMSVRFRLDRHFQMSAVSLDEEVEAFAIDLSQQGMALATDLNIPIAALLSLRFDIFKTNGKGEVKFLKPIEVTGEVRSNIPLDDKQRRLGICFKEFQEEDREELVDFIDTALSR